MALFYECMLQCARKVLDAADIVRDGDVTTVNESRSARWARQSCNTDRIR